MSFERVECRPWPVRRRIPLFIGGDPDAAIRRAARYGDGYFPFVFPGHDPLVELPRLLGQVRRATAEAGRDPDDMEFTAGGARTAEDARIYADLGVHRLTVAVRGRTAAEMREHVARLGDELVAPTAEL